MNGWLPDALNIRSVRVDKALLRRILDALDNNPCSFELNKRRYERLPYRGRQVILYTKQTERDVAFIVPTRNISRGGMSFLHGQMMHLDQACTVDLATNDGNWMTVEGTVVRCRHVRGMIHEIGLKFNTLISLEDLRDLPVAGGPPAVETLLPEEVEDTDVGISVPPPQARPIFASQPPAGHRLLGGSGSSKR